MSKRAEPSQPPNDTVPKNMGTFHSLIFRNYRFLWFGSIFSSLSQYLQRTTLSWLVYDFTGSGVLLGTINALAIIPTILLSPLSGVAADRFDKKRLLSFTQFALLLLTLGIGFLFLLGIANVWYLMVFAILAGIPQAINQPVRSSIVPLVVPREALPNATALNSGAFVVSRLVGPGIAGLLIGYVGAEANFFIQSTAYGFVILTIYMLTLPKNGSASKKRSFKSDVLEGFKYISKNKAVRALMFLTIFQSMLIQPFLQTLLVIFARDKFDAGSEGFGFLLSASAVGSMLGVLFLASTSQIEKRGLIQLVSLTAFGVCAVVFTFAQSLWQGLLIIAVAGIFQVMFLTTNQALIMLSVPPRLMGRVSGVLAIEQALLPAGALLTGSMADLIGFRETALLMGFICIGSGLCIGLLSERIRNLGPKTAMVAQEEADLALNSAPR